MSEGLRVSARTMRGEVLPSTMSIDASYTGDDADWDGTPGVGGNDQWKQPVRVATTASITIATALNNGDTLDGVTLATGDRVLVKNQGTASQNGIYIVGATPARAEDMDDDDEVVGAVVFVVAGTANAGTTWRVTNTTEPVVDTDAINWAAFLTTPTLDLDDLADVDTTGVADGDALVYDSGTSTWGPAAVGGSGAVATDTIWDAKGDLAAGTGSNTAAKLSVGTNGYVLTADSAEATGLKWAAAASVLFLPPITQAIGNYQNSGTTNVVTLGATPTGALIAFVMGTSRGATSISQTNVTWTQRYTGNGNSQYAEVWTGAITGAAGTGVTANFGSATRSEFVVIELNQSALTTVGTAVTSTSAGSTQLASGFLTSPSAGDLCVYMHAAAGPSSSVGGLNVPYYSYDFAGGQGSAAIFYHRGGASFATRVISSSVAYFTAMMKVS